MKAYGFKYSKPTGDTTRPHGRGCIICYPKPIRTNGGKARAHREGKAACNEAE